MMDPHPARLPLFLSAAALSAALSLLSSRAVLAQDASQAQWTNKRDFTLLNPTPRALMRPMSPDRPDVTESPQTVDAGHFQIEMSFAELGFDSHAGVKTRATSLLSTNLKVGLLNNMDLQFVFTPYERLQVRAHGSTDVASGFSDDTEVRLKINFWGNDAPPAGTPDPWGGTAFGIMPFIKFPTGTGGLSNHHVEGGLIVPFSADLPQGWELGLMAEVDFVYNEASGGYGVDLVHTATVGHDVPGMERLGFFIEYIGIAPHQTGGTYQALGSVGLTYTVNEDWILDCGTMVGLSRSAPDVLFFIGTSLRL